ncbi:hypothetical protein Tco_1203119 [Tanacetum coccineum]
MQSPIRPYPLIPMDYHGAHPLLLAHVPDPIELDEHVPVYVLEPEHLEYHVPTDDDIQVEDQPYANDASPTAESPGHIADSESMEKDSINYPDEPEDGEEDDDEDSEEDSEEDPEEDPSEEHEPADDEDDDDTNDEDEEPTEDEDEEEHLALADSSVVLVVDHVPSARDTEAFETDESAPTPRSPHTRVLFSQTRLRRTQKTVRLEPPMSASMEARIAEHAAAPIPPTSPVYDQAPLGRTGLIRSPGHDAQTIASALTEQRMLTRRELDSRLMALLARLETLETHISRMVWQHQRAEDDAVRQMMRIYVLEARAQIDKLIDSRRIMPVTRQRTNDAMTPESIQAMIDREIQRNSTHTQDDASHSSGGGLRRHVQTARVCSYTDFMKCQPLNFKGTEGVVGLSQWLEKME